MTKSISLTFGSLLALAGLLGFVVPGGLGMHWDPVQNWLHLLSGGMAWYFGSLILPAAKSFCRAFGVVYLLWALIGFAATSHGGPWIPRPLTPQAMTVLMHGIIGGLFLVTGLYKSPAIRLPPNIQR